ncbi:MAG TPA: membrane protein insertase YidC [Burkholderiales bacterium]|nr:membrane protein insertase YidC [Burkholderiales bacterium]
MDTQRLFLFVIFTFSLFLLIDAWQKERHPAPPLAEQKAAQPGPQAGAPAAPPIPAAGGTPTAAPPAEVVTRKSGQPITVVTDFVRAEIDTLGGDLRRLELLRHRDTIDQDKVFVLLQNDAQHVYLLQSGLLGGELPNHKTQYTAAATHFQLEAGTDTLEVRLDAPPVAGVAVTKVYVFHASSYLIDVRYEIRNGGATALSPHAYYQLVRDGKPPAGDSDLVPTYTGAAVYTDKEKFHKIPFADLDKGKATVPKEATDGWIAMLQHYFLSALLPPPSLAREYYAKRLDSGLYAVGVVVPVGAIAPGATASVDVPIYAGPQEQDKLAPLAPGLDLSVDYGWLTIIAAPLFWVLQGIHRFVGNWGLAIIVLTVLIKLLFYPLSAASYRSMARMRVIAPKLQRLKEQYGDDRQRMHQAMMEMYKTEKINPLGGCLPVAVQIPVFISLYWVLLASVELRHAPFALWIHDLARPDPYYVLPLLMGATMLIQTKLNPEPPDPVQAKVMKIMPIAFSVFFFFFPAGLVLYWLVNNILSIAQQWHITRAAEQASAAHGKR